MFEKGSFYEIRSSVESLAYPKSVMFFTVCAMIGKDNFEPTCTWTKGENVVYLFILERKGPILWKN